MSDNFFYKNWLESKEREWESRCLSCGSCCGALEDPCEHLARLSEGKYSCRIYENRFGVHKTIKGNLFKCVPLREILHSRWPGDECCGYKKKYILK